MSLPLRIGASGHAASAVCCRAPYADVGRVARALLDE
jgi:hypothetical protein